MGIFKLSTCTSAQQYEEHTITFLSFLIEHRYILLANNITVDVNFNCID